MEKELDKNNILYWKYRISQLGAARLIKEKFPWFLKPFVKIYVNDVIVDVKRNSIFVYWGINHFPEKDKEFCCEITANYLNKASGNSKVITSKK